MEQGFINHARLHLRECSSIAAMQKNEKACAAKDPERGGG